MIKLTVPHSWPAVLTTYLLWQAVLDEFRQGDEARLADLVVCDGAPDVTGMHDLDEYVQVRGQ